MGVRLILRPPTPVVQAGSQQLSWNVDRQRQPRPGEKTITLTLQQEGERLTGSISGPLGAGEISNASTSNSGEVRFTVPLNVEGQTKEATFTGTLADNEIRGNVAIVGSAPGTFTAHAHAKLISDATARRKCIATRRTARTLLNGVNNETIIATSVS